MRKSTLDPSDRHLLDLVQRDALRTTDALADLAGISPSSVQRRLKRLRDEGVITAHTAVVDPASVGQAMTFVVGIEIEQKRPDLYANLKRWLADHDAVQQAYNVTGSSDFILVVTAATLEDYDSLMGRMVARNPNIRKYVTSVVLQTFKRTLFTPAGGSGDEDNGCREAS